MRSDSAAQRAPDSESEHVRLDAPGSTLADDLDNFRPASPLRAAVADVYHGTVHAPQTTYFLRSASSCCFRDLAGDPVRGRLAVLTL